MKYDYKCTSSECGVTFEVNQPMTSRAEAQCPQCKEITSERLVTGGYGFQLKGNGWASDLYSSKK